MQRYIIEYDTGYGFETEVIDATNENDALKQARESWINSCGDSQYEVKGEWSENLAKELDIEDA